MVIGCVKIYRGDSLVLGHNLELYRIKNDDSLVCGHGVADFQR
jgi:hypothetical protein